MKDSTNKIKILKTLLESPKNTGQLAIELGYIDDKGHGRYHIIEKDLNTLGQYGLIRRFKQQNKSSGKPPTTYDIVYEIPDLRKMLEKYPSLVSALQKNDIVLSMLVAKHAWMINPIPLYNFKIKIEENLEDLKRQLSLSPSFFKLCIDNEPDNIKKRVYTIHENMNKFIKKIDPEAEVETFYEILESMKLDMNVHTPSTVRISELCFFYDILNGIV